MASHSRCSAPGGPMTWIEPSSVPGLQSCSSVERHRVAVARAESSCSGGTLRHRAALSHVGHLVPPR